MYTISYGREEEFRPRRGRPTVRTGETRGIRKSQRITTDPGGVDHQATIPKRLGDPARVLDEVLSNPFPWVGTHGFFWIAPSGLAILAPCNLILKKIIPK